MILATRSLTDRPFNVNVFCHQPVVRDAVIEGAWINKLSPLFDEFGSQPPAKLHEIYTSFVVDDETTAMLIEVRPPVVSFHFGLPSQQVIDALRKQNVTLLATATNVAEAEAIEAAGIDAIVAQGYEAGGHRGSVDPAALG